MLQANRRLNAMGQNESSFAKIRRKALQYKRQTNHTHKLMKRLLMEVNSTLHTEDYGSVTPLWLASYRNDTELVRLLLRLGADPNQSCASLQMTPLHIATSLHNLQMMESLLQAGAHTNVLDRWNYSSMMYAAIHHDATVVVDMFNILLKYRSDVNYGAILQEDAVSEDNNNGNNLQINRDLPQLRSCYNDGDYITYVREPMGPVSGTALHLAVQNPHLPNEALQLLLDSGADVDLKNLYGQTPLMAAMLDRFYDYHKNIKSHAELILNFGAGVALTDIRGWTCFHYAAQRGSISCMQQLMSANADPNVIATDQESPLWILLAHGWREATRFLIQSGCNVNQPVRSTVILHINPNVDLCRHGYILPIEFAVCNRYYGLAELMVQVGCDIDDGTWLGSHLDPPHTRHKEFIRLLKHNMGSRGKLKQLSEVCRDATRQIMKHNIVAKCKVLPLPQPLKDYICHVDFPLGNR